MLAVIPDSIGRNTLKYTPHSGTRPSTTSSCLLPLAAGRDRQHRGMGMWGWLRLLLCLARAHHSARHRAVPCGEHGEQPCSLSRGNAESPQALRKPPPWCQRLLWNWEHHLSFPASGTAAMTLSDVSTTYPQMLNKPLVWKVFAVLHLKTNAQAKTHWWFWYVSNCLVSLRGQVLPK